MTPYAAFMWLTLTVCALGFALAGWDLLVGWLADGSDAREAR